MIGLARKRTHKRFRRNEPSRQQLTFRLLYFNAKPDHPCGTSTAAVSIEALVSHNLITVDGQHGHIPLQATLSFEGMLSKMSYCRSSRNTSSRNISSRPTGSFDTVSLSKTLQVRGQWRCITVDVRPLLAYYGPYRVF